MNKYEVYYIWRDKKFREIVEAKDKYAAENIIIDKLEIVKVELREGTEPEQNKNYDKFDPSDIMGIFGGNFK